VALEQAIVGPRFDVGEQAEVSRAARLETLVDAHYGLIWRVLRRMGLAAHAADDAAQQVFLIVMERLEDIKPGSERAFAFGTALRVARSARRKVAREVVGDCERDACPLPDPEALSDQKRARDMLDESGDPIDYQEYDEMRTSFGWEALDVLEDLLLAAGLIEVEDRT